MCMFSIQPDQFWKRWRWLWRRQLSLSSAYHKNTKRVQAAELVCTHDIVDNLSSLDILTLRRPLLPYGYSYMAASCARPGYAVICNFWHPGTLALSADRLIRTQKETLHLHARGTLAVLVTVIICYLTFEQLRQIWCDKLIDNVSPDGRGGVHLPAAEENDPVASSAQLQPRWLARRLGGQ